jgi:hypothetical protein
VPAAKYGESQIGKNLKEALIMANPLVDTAVGASRGYSMGTILQRQLPGLSTYSGMTPAEVARYPQMQKRLKDQRAKAAEKYEQRKK